MSRSNSNASRSWPYANVPGSKPHLEPIIISVPSQNETRWVECRELPPVTINDLESQGTTTQGPRTSRLSRLSMLNHDDITNFSAHDESGRRGFHPWTFLVICWNSSSCMSMMTNSLWPFTIAALVLHFCDTSNQLWIFVTAYIGMVPAANLVGFAGHQLARKLPTTFGVLVETAIGSCVELVLLTVLIQQPGHLSIRVIRAVILGSILANLLLCLGLCFFVGGIFYPNQSFHVAISEVACNLMLVAGMGLVIPSIFYNSLRLSSNHSDEFLEVSALRLSRVVAVVLLLAFLAYLWFQTRSHFGIYQDILQADESRDRRHQHKAAAKLTLTEALVAVAIGVTFVSFMAVFLVQQIEYIVIDRNLSEEFKGLILVPIVEKVSEHLTAMNKARQNQMNYAIAQVLGSSIQTALLNTPLVILVGWALGKEMSLNFEVFDAAMLILAVIVVSSFLKDGKSDYLEGMLGVFVYLLIAVAAFYYPNPTAHGQSVQGSAGGE